jgi:hypothetical protein
MTTRPPVMYSQAVITDAFDHGPAPLLRTQNRSAATPRKKASPRVAP